MEQLVLTARVSLEAGNYVARVDNLPVVGTGGTLEEAQEELIQAMRSWIEAQDGQDKLEQFLAEAGFPGVEENTELQLEFVA